VALGSSFPPNKSSKKNNKQTNKTQNPTPTQKAKHKDKTFHTKKQKQTNKK
jgi:hypothetical protein